MKKRGLKAGKLTEGDKGMRSLRVVLVLLCLVLAVTSVVAAPGDYSLQLRLGVNTIEGARLAAGVDFCSAANHPARWVNHLSLNWAAEDHRTLYSAIAGHRWVFSRFGAGIGGGPVSISERRTRFGWRPFFDYALTDHWAVEANYFKDGIPCSHGPGGCGCTFQIAYRR